MNVTKKYIRRLFKICRKPEMKILPGNIAFFLVLSIFPIITLFGFLASFFNVSIQSVVDFMNSALPSDVNKILLPFITGSGMDLHVGFSIIIGYYVASNGANSIIVSCDTLYGIKSGDYISRKLKSLFITILLVFVFVFSLVVLAFGNSILKFILSLNFFTDIADNIYYIFLFFKWPFAVIFIYFILKLIFVLTPDFRISGKYVIRGALFTSFSWIISTFIYSYYVQYFSHYDIFYGSLSNIIVMMMWIYILSYSLVFGIAINVQHYKDSLNNI